MRVDLIWGNDGERREKRGREDGKERALEGRRGGGKWRIDNLRRDQELNHV